MFYKTVLLLTVVVAIAPEVHGLKCYDCEGVANLADCTNLTICQLGEVCSATIAERGSSRFYALGCASQQQCSQMIVPTLAQMVIGRAVSQCYNMCCSEDLCNQNLCPNNLASSTPGQCQDDPSYNCAHVISTFDICSDIQHAKSACKKSCNLCDMVDGGWSDWSSWSACDVTCESGHVTRMRTCTNPAPAKGGMDCVGAPEESQTCTRAKCPVAGGWSDWEQWSTCSKTCGIGMRNHIRACSNPYPALGGRDCDGDSTQYDTCFEQPCANGGWSDWSAWDSCSVTCNGGITSRSRLCNNPSPSQFGQQCAGDSHDYTACSTTPCQGDTVFFSVNSPDGRKVDGGVPLFSVLASNAGQGYNESDGCFHCDTPGVYSFSMTLLADNSSSTYCYVKHNGVNVGYTQATASGGSLQSGSSSIYLSLAQLDKVCPVCGGWGSVHKSIGTSFMGALLRQ